ncbi:MAG: hypothetical protein K2X63_04845 [Burkholderiaceae bacterium]|jgi:hypothetical protein|nr:hypothetical protein [Burkholderiaceae bacterium]
MSTGIFDKTAKGRAEISTRQFQLPAKIRTLLVMIDGKRPIAELFKQTQGLGLSQENIDYLLDEGFIAELAEPASSPDPISTPSAPAAPTIPTAPPVQMMDEVKRLQALHNFFNSTIKSTLGLRGFSLQLKTERAATLQEFADLRRPYVEAVNKAKGREMAISLRDRLDQLLFTENDAARDPIISDE